LSGALTRTHIHTLDTGQVSKLDKRIALLIKNRGVLVEDEDEKKKKKKKKKRKKGTIGDETDSSIAARELFKDRRKVWGFGGGARRRAVGAGCVSVCVRVCVCV